MDLLSFALQIVFIAPLIARALARRQSPGDGGADARTDAGVTGGPGVPGAAIANELAATFRTPGLFVHIVGLLLVWIGFDVALYYGRLDRGITWLNAIGCGLLLAATLLMIWSLRTLRSWRLLPRIEGGHELCTVGPYRLVRHPIYLAFDLLGLGVVCTAPLPVVILGAILIVIAGEMRARAEERALVSAFGARYEDYCARVARRIPGVY